MEVVDYFGPHDLAFMRCLALAGVAGIARYLTNNPADPRQITAQEVGDAHAAGLAVHFFYEMNPTYPGYFTRAQGAEDCRQAVARLEELGAPEGTVVYFAVDAPPSRIPVTLLDEYLLGVGDMVTPQLAPGLYGFEAHVEYVRTRFPQVGEHLAQTYGTPRGRLDLWQHEQVDMCGVAVDVDEATVEGWRDMLPEEAKAIAEKAIADAGLDPETVAVIKHKLDGHIHALVPNVNQTTVPLFPPVKGALYGGSSADLRQIFWDYPDGTRHTFYDGKEVL
jgi:hypothetical protein